MDTTGLVLSIIGTIAGIVSAYFGYVAVRQEYAALMQRSIEDGVRFIPVVVGDVTLPAFAATRYHVDFRQARAGAGYERRVDEIAQALRSPGR